MMHEQAVPRPALAAEHGRGHRSPSPLRRTWGDERKRYFLDGPANPEYCLIKVVPASAQYRYLKATGFEATDVL